MGILDAIPTPVRQSLRNEIHAPVLVGTRCWALSNPLPLCPLLPLLRTHDQSLLGVQTINPLGVHFPALPLQHHCQPSIAVPHTAAGQLALPHPQRILRIGVMLVAQRHPVNRDQPRSTPLAQLVDLLRPLGKLATQARLYKIFL